MTYTVRKSNAIIKAGSIGVLICKAKGRSFSAIVDAEDIPKVRLYFWWVFQNKKKFYVATTINYRHTLLHRYLFGHDVPKIIDHENGRGTDNRKSNLRAATDSQNQANRGTRKDKFKGVFVKRPGQYFASIKHNRKIIHIGSFKDPKAAALAYDAKAKEIFGDFASLNFPEGQ